MLCSLTGTLFIYQGQEIGMINVPLSWPISEYRDIESVNFYNTMAAKIDPSSPDAEQQFAYLRTSLQKLARDNARLPMQWDGSAHAGFTDADGPGPWMRVHDLYGEINVEQQIQEGEGSVLGFWKRMIRLRKGLSEILVHGEFEGFEMEDERTFVFGKKGKDGRRAAVVLNFTGEEQEVTLPEYEGLMFEIGSYEDAKEEEEKAKGRVRRLRSWEGRLYLTGC
jgi:oligo-1,6-glucosidase